MKFSYWKYIYIIIVIIFLVFNYAIIIFDINALSDYSDIIELFGIIFSIHPCILAIKYLPNEYKISWIWFLITACLFFIGDSLWSYILHTTGSDPVTPSICDVFYLSNTITCVIGLVYYLLHNKSINFANLSLDLFISIFASAGIIYIATVMPMLQEEDIELNALMVEIAYPIGDIILLFALFILFFNTDSGTFFHKTHLFMALSFLVMFCADQISLIDSIYELNILKYAEPIFGISHLLLAISGLYACEEELKDNNADDIFIVTTLNKRIFDNIRILIPYILTFSVLAYVAIDRQKLEFSSIWALLLFILLSCRQMYVIVRNKKLLIAIQKSRNKLNKKNLELEKLNKKIKHDAQIDFLTQLWNRRHIDNALTELEPCNSNLDNIGLLLIDVDLFKHINDDYGHQVGDAVLQNVANCIRSVVRDGDIAGRFGGDEFIILLPGANNAVVDEISNNLIAAVHSNAILAQYKVTLSIGGSSWQLERGDYHVNRLLKMADMALYRAKDGGRNSSMVLEY